MKFVFKEWLKDKKASALVMLYLICHTIYAWLDAQLISMISRAISDADHFQSNLMNLGIMAAVIVVLYTALSFIPSTARNHCFTQINNRHIDKLLDADFEMFTKFSCSRIWTAGEFMWKIVDVGFTMIYMVGQGLTIVVLMWSMYLVAKSLLVPVIVIYLVAILVFKRIYKKFEENAKKSKEFTMKRNQEAENIVNGFAEVRSFDTVRQHRESLHGLNYNIFNMKAERTKISVTMHGAIEVLEKLGMFICVAASMWLITEGKINQSEAMALVMYVIKLVPPLLQILDFTDELSEQLKLREDFEKIQYYEDRHHMDGTITLDSFNTSIKLEDVSFAYSDTSKAVNHVSLEIKKGQRVGICGVSGGGKSTLFKLINRFYKVDGGRIMIDGINIEDITSESFHRHIGCVHQENTIFPGTIRQNILYGSPNCLEWEMIEACKRASIYEFISSLPDKFETEVGPKGLTLSGGQKQRIALARLFLRNPQIILLDEATSALDNESETLIQDAIDHLEGKTILTIAHRLSTIKNSDVIYVMGPEGILESGTHDELMMKKGAYFSMNK